MITSEKTISELALICAGLTAYAAAQSIPGASFFLGNGAPGAGSYQLIDDYEPSIFFNKFNFYSAYDPTYGHVQYVNQSVATANGFVSTTSSNTAKISVDTTNEWPRGGPGRPSVRVISDNTYTHGLFILDAVHMPWGCGTWPAYWLLGPDWPYTGEIDIIEGVNTNTQDSISLHSSPNCTIAGSGQTGTLQTTNCDSNANGNSGCGSTLSNTTIPNNYGNGFNTNQGGIYATEWTSSYFKTWFFQRGSIPASITSGKPDTSTFGTPVVNQQGSCNIDQHFTNMSIIINIDFCGAWAGQVYSQYSDCPQNASAGNSLYSCVDFVGGNPSYFTNAYWEINSIKVYQMPLNAQASSSYSTSLSSATPQSTATANSVPFGMGVSSTSTSSAPYTGPVSSVTTSTQAAASTPAICPNSNSTVWNDSNGAGYTIGCGLDYNGAGTGLPGNGIYSATSFENCLEICDGTSGCIAVAFIGGNGAGTCYAKSTKGTFISSGGANAAIKVAQGASASVSVQGPSPSSPVCPAAGGTTYIDTQSVSYGIVCYTDYAGNNIGIPLSESSLTACLPSCDSMSGCAGVVFNPTYNLCQMKSSFTGTQSNNGSVVAARRNAAVVVSSSSATKSSSTSTVAGYAYGYQPQQPGYGSIGGGYGTTTTPTTKVSVNTSNGQGPSAISNPGSTSVSATSTTQSASSSSSALSAISLPSSTTTSSVSASTASSSVVPSSTTSASISSTMSPALSSSTMSSNVASASSSSLSPQLSTSSAQYLSSAVSKSTSTMTVSSTATTTSTTTLSSSPPTSPSSAMSSMASTTSTTLSSPPTSTSSSITASLSASAMASTSSSTIPVASSSMSALSSTLDSSTSSMPIALLTSSASASNSLSSFASSSSTISASSLVNSVTVSQTSLPSTSPLSSTLSTSSSASMVASSSYSAPLMAFNASSSASASISPSPQVTSVSVTSTYSIGQQPGASTVSAVTSASPCPTSSAAYCGATQQQTCADNNGAIYLVSCGMVYSGDIIDTSGVYGGGYKLLARATEPDVASCQKLCDATNACVAFNFINKNCVLLSRVTSGVTQPSAIGGSLIAAAPSPVSTSSANPPAYGTVSTTTIPQGYGGGYGATTSSAITSSTTSSASSIGTLSSSSLGSGSVTTAVVTTTVTTRLPTGGYYTTGPSGSYYIYSSISSNTGSASLCYTCSLTPTVVTGGTSCSSTAVGTTTVYTTSTITTCPPQPTCPASGFLVVGGSQSYPGQQVVTTTDNSGAPLTYTQTPTSPRSTPSSTTGTSGTGSSDVTMGNTTQPVCPGSDGTIYTDSMGMQYQIYCGVLFTNATLDIQTQSTLANCIASCDMYNTKLFYLGDQCLGVTFYENLATDNCFLKTGTNPVAVHACDSCALLTGKGPPGNGAGNGGGGSYGGGGSGGGGSGSGTITYTTVVGGIATTTTFTTTIPASTVISYSTIYTSGGSTVTAVGTTTLPPSTLVETSATTVGGSTIVTQRQAGPGYYGYGGSGGGNNGGGGGYAPGPTQTVTTTTTSISLVPTTIITTVSQGYTTTIVTYVPAGGGPGYYGGGGSGGGNGGGTGAGGGTQTVTTTTTSTTTSISVTSVLTTIMTTLSQGSTTTYTTYIPKTYTLAASTPPPQISTVTTTTSVLTTVTTTVSQGYTTTYTTFVPETFTYTIGGSSGSGAGGSTVTVSAGGNESTTTVYLTVTVTTTVLPVSSSSSFTCRTYATNYLNGLHGRAEPTSPPIKYQGVVLDPVVPIPKLQKTSIFEKHVILAQLARMEELQGPPRGIMSAEFDLWYVE